jgi:hypothetical protein
MEPQLDIEWTGYENETPLSEEEFPNHPDSSSNVLGEETLH